MENCAQSMITISPMIPWVPSLLESGVSSCLFKSAMLIQFCQVSLFLCTTWMLLCPGLFNTEGSLLCWCIPTLVVRTKVRFRIVVWIEHQMYSQTTASGLSGLAPLGTWTCLSSLPTLRLSPLVAIWAISTTLFACLMVECVPLEWVPPVQLMRLRWCAVLVLHVSAMDLLMVCATASKSS